MVSRKWRQVWRDFIWKLYCAVLLAALLSFKKSSTIFKQFCEIIEGFLFHSVNLRGSCWNLGRTLGELAKNLGNLERNLGNLGMCLWLHTVRKKNFCCWGWFKGSRGFKCCNVGSADWRVQLIFRWQDGIDSLLMITLPLDDDATSLRWLFSFLMTAPLHVQVRGHSHSRRSSFPWNRQENQVKSTKKTRFTFFPTLLSLIHPSHLLLLLWGLLLLWLLLSSL